MERRLAAVLAADVAGYSRLMGTDEEGTLARLKAVRKALVDPVIASHRGRIVKTTGDGMLVEFASAVDAARCAFEVQRGMASHSADVPQAVKIEFRIGIHVGDIIFDEADIFGDGVNIAARLEGIAEPGGVCISDDAQRQVRGKVDIGFDDMGLQTLKNIAEPIRAWRFRTGTEAAPPNPLDSLSQQPPALVFPDKPSIAVLPFQNMSGDPEQEYFADGMVEEIITALSRFNSLFVIARNSSFAYKGRSPDIRQVGRDLGVRYVLEGSVRRGGNRLRITAQLIDAQSGAHIWADRYEGSPEDVFKLQDDVTENVIIAIEPRVERAEMARASRRPSRSTDAYDFFLKGLACYFPGNAQGLDQALNLFSKATALDPDFASAHAMAMACHANRIGLQSVKDLARGRDEVVRLWQIVARVGNDDGRALAVAAWSVAYMLGDLASAKELIDRAVELNPNLFRAQANAGWISLWLGHPELAVEQLRRAQRLDPLSDTFLPMPLAHAYFYLERYDEALDQARSLLHRHPDNHAALRIGAASAAFAERAEVAHQLASRLLEVDPAFSVSRLSEYLGPYRRLEFVEKYAEGLRRAGVQDESTVATTAGSD